MNTLQTRYRAGGRSIIANYFRLITYIVFAVVTFAMLANATQARAEHPESKDAPPRTPPQTKTLTNLERAELHFGTGAFQSSAAELKPLLVDDSSLTREEKARLYILKARLDLAFGAEDNLDIWLGRAFRADPSIDMDPLKDPPQLVAKWSQLKRSAINGSSPEKMPPGLQVSHTEVAGVDSRGKSFAAGLMPFGLAQLNASRNKDAALFFTTSLAGLLLAHDLPPAKTGSNVLTTPRRREFFSGSLLLGVYGYQLLDMSPELFDRNPAAAEAVYAGLSLAPFGVGQLRNNEPVKAIVFALIEGTALAIAGYADTEQHRNTARAVFAGSLVVGAIDATIGYRSMAPRKTAGREFKLIPLLARNNVSKDSIGVELTFLVN